MLVIGAPNSSNSKRLVEVGRAAGCQYAQLVQRAEDIDWRALEGIRGLAITAGAGVLYYSHATETPLADVSGQLVAKWWKAEDAKDPKAHRR